MNGLLDVTDTRGPFKLTCQIACHLTHVANEFTDLARDFWKSLWAENQQGADEDDHDLHPAHAHDVHRVVSSDEPNAPNCHAAWQNRSW